MSYRSLLNSTCNIQEATQTSDGMGGFTEAWNAIHLGIACRCFELSAKEQAVYGREGVMITHRFYIEHMDGIAEPMRVVHGSSNYDIKGVRDMAGLKEHMVLETERVK